MVIRNHDVTGTQLFCILLYKFFAKYLPNSYTPVIGGISKKLRYFCVSHIFEYCGKNVNVERRVNFGNGFRIRIGDNSGMGTNANIPDGTIIGSNVLMGPNCYIHARNHRFDRLDIPIGEQGYTEIKTVIIGDDVWIGRDVTILPGRIISSGSVIAANCVYCKDFPEFSVVGGNPSRLLKNRKQIQVNASNKE